MVMAAGLSSMSSSKSITIRVPPKDFLFFMPHERYSSYLARLQLSRSEQPLQESLQESLQQLPFPFFLK